MALVGLLLCKAADYLIEKQEMLLVKALHLGQNVAQIEIQKEIEGRIFALFWIPTCTLSLAQFFLYVSELSTERRQKALVNWVLTKRITNVDLEAADLDNDGVVGFAEFVLYKLKEMGKINQEDVSLVMEEFEALDYD
ncbi:hypothetical protein LguiA_002308 [Lonicera macranthoides]